MDFGNLARRVSKLATDNSPTVLTAIGVVGTITTAYLAGKASFEAADMIRLKEGIDYANHEDPREPKEIFKDRIKLVGRLYIPTITVGTASIACIIFANQIGSRRAAGMAAAYTILEKTSEEYKDKIVEKFGPRKAESVRDEIAQDRVRDTYHDGVEIYGAQQGELCYDMFGGQYFLSTIQNIEDARNSLNHLMITDGQACLADFYRLLDIPAPGFSESIGWNSDRLLELDFSSTLTNTDKPCITMTFKHDPLPDYGRFRTRF